MTRALAIAIGVILMVVPALAGAAKPRVAIVPFDGDPNYDVADVVAELVEDDYNVTGAKQTGRSIDQLGLDAASLSDKDIKKLSNELDADAVIRGELAPKGPRKLLHIRVTWKGKKARGFNVEYASLKSKKMRAALKEKLLEKLSADGAKKTEPSDDADPVRGGKKGDRDDSDEPDKADRETRGEKDDEDPDGGKRGKRTARGGEDDEEIDGAVEVTPIKQNPHTANRAAIRVDFGPSASSRTLSFASRNFEEAPKPYQNTVVPGGRVGGALFPFAFSNPDSFLAGFGVAGDFDQTVGLKLTSTAQPGSKFPVIQKHWSVGLRIRIAFGRKATSPTVTLGAGIMRRMFKVDRAALEMGNVIDLPDVYYKGFDPGLEVRIPFAKAVALVFGGKAILVTDAGQISKGEQYGQARITGGEGTAGLDLTFGKIAVRLQGEATQLGYAFAGNGDMSNNRDGNPMTKDVGGASDRYIGGSLTFGVLY